MNWFEEQIKQRKQSDDDAFADSFINIAGAVIGEKATVALRDSRILARNAMEEVLKYYHVKGTDIPDSIVDVDKQLEYLMRPHGIMRRDVDLKKGWYKDAAGAMLGVRKDNKSIVALIPRRIKGYKFLNTDTGRWENVNSFNESMFEEAAMAFYKPFPLKEMNIRDLVKYMIQSIDGADVIILMVVIGIASLVGMLVPRINKLLFSTVIEMKSVAFLVAVTIFLFNLMVSMQMMEIVKSLATARINAKLGVSIEAATMMRVLSLPATFFKDYSAGELSSRTSYINTLCEIIISTFMTTALTSVFSLVYIGQIYRYAPTIAMPAFMIILVTVLFSVVTSLVQMKISKQQMELSTKEQGISYGLISGIQKIRLSGAEKRAFAKWGNCYAEEAKLSYDPPIFIKLNPVISLAISSIGMLVIYVEAIKAHETVSDFTAFNASYGMVSGAFMSLAGVALNLAQIKPILEMVEPILKNAPEVSEGKQMLTRLSGSVEINNLSFRYNENMPYVLDDFSLRIKPGQYVAVVGKTGCGKSTLVRLLLGFEKAQKGAIYFDGKDINTIDPKSLRKLMGVVTQDGKLFQGDIYSNITISAPELGMDEAWEAAEMAGMADDIRDMPMGMFTMISEGSGGVSGGQRQRLMIARAIAPKPKILIFDEATSALDNITQKKVSDSLDSMKCTRIVIAHRLSTIKQCDRVIVIDGGHIIEDGTYEELLANKGFFAELVERQRIDENT